jgi:hypothetical protein
MELILFGPDIIAAETYLKHTNQGYSIYEYPGETCGQRKVSFRISNNKIGLELVTSLMNTGAQINSIELM